mmetsp:Transcript_4409/g.4934  ORF Transcript_4409/g.4934 Transcript_4409/m.4934 type:complete len:220 (-) Transcript_4409:355-1014(-)
MVNSLKLQYFNIHGRGEPIRALLHYKQANFTDEVITFEEWPELKGNGSFPHGQLPVLEVDGYRMNQEDAILQFLGSRHGLLLNDARGRYLVNYYLCATEDLFKTVYNKYLFGSNEDEKKAAKADLIENQLPIYLADFEKKFLAEKGDETGWLVGGKPTIADIKVVTNINTFFLHPDRKSCFYPVLTKHAPNFIKYVENKTTGDFSGFFSDSTNRANYGC